MINLSTYLLNVIYLVGQMIFFDSRSLTIALIINTFKLFKKIIMFIINQSHYQVTINKKNIKHKNIHIFQSNQI